MTPSRIAPEIAHRRKSSHALPILATAALLVASLLAPAAAAQLAVDVPPTASGVGRVIAAQATPSCSGGLVYDDGGRENIVRLTLDDQGTEADTVMRFDVGEADSLVEQVCVCWNRNGNPPATFLHSLIFYEDGGNGPGDEIAIVPASINNVPLSPSNQFFAYDIADEDIRSTGDSLYIGVRFFGGDGPDGHFLCVDQNGPGNQAMYASVAAAEDWVDWDELVANTSLDPTQALMIRADVEEDEVEVETCPATACVEDDTTLCLNNDRFRVTGSFVAPDGDGGFDSGPAQAAEVELTADTSYFYFFRETNVEMVVKVLNGCGVNQHYWVFAGGLTNVEVEMTVCDTQEGLQRTYRNPQGAPFQPIQDTAAFATCP